MTLTPRTDATRSSHAIVGDAPPRRMRQACVRLTPARSARWLIGIRFSLAMRRTLETSAR